MNYYVGPPAAGAASISLYVLAKSAEDARRNLNVGLRFESFEEADAERRRNGRLDVVVFEVFILAAFPPEQGDYSPIADSSGREASRLDTDNSRGSGTGRSAL
jgi:hypothetical protein